MSKQRAGFRISCTPSSVRSSEQLFGFQIHLTSIGRPGRFRPCIHGVHPFRKGTISNIFRHRKSTSTRMNHTITQAEPTLKTVPGMITRIFEIAARARSHRRPSLDRRSEGLQIRGTGDRAFRREQPAHELLLRGSRPLPSAYEP